MLSKLSTFFTLAIAVGAALASPHADAKLEARNNYVIKFGSGSLCQANTLSGSSTRCYAKGGNSIKATGNCKVITWSGSDCHGSHKTIDVNGSCNEVPFAGIQVIC